MKTIFSRNNSFCGKTLLIDGMTGTGKTLILKLLSSLRNSHPPVFKYVLEQICIAHYYKKISTDAAVNIIKLIIDQSRYDLSISREINLRFRDLSSILKSPNKYSYLKGLLLDDSDLHNSKIEKTLPIIVHQLHQSSKVIDLSTESPIYRIICVRHPLYLFDHWNSYVSNHGANPRDFTMTVKFEEHDIPWFINYDMKKFAKSDSADKSAISISLLSKAFQNFVRNNRDSKLVVIDFEKFVLKPYSYLAPLESVLGTLDFYKIKKIFKREKIPRSVVSKGRNLSIYRRYSANLISTEFDNKREYLGHKNRVNKLISRDVVDKFMEACNDYEKTYGLWF